MHSLNSGFQSIAPRVPLILTVCGALAAMFLVGAAIGQGEFAQVYLLLIAAAGLGIILALGSKYWLLIPIAFSLNLPVIPFGGRAFELPELAIGLCTVVFLCRFAMRPRGMVVFRGAHAGVLLYSAWAALIFALHPVGLSVMGSSLGGARFYFKIALALASFLIVANQQITESDAKWMIRLLLIGSIVGMAVGIARYKLLGSAYQNPNAAEDYYTWQQELGLPAMWIMIWLVARYKTPQLFSLSKPWIPILAFLCIAVAAISGKRAAFAAVLLAPLVAAAVRKEYFHVLVGGMVAIVVLLILTVGQGPLFRLPLQAQRALSYLPGNWDWEVRAEFQSGIDPFREEMRELAWNNIEKRPLFGEGYAVNMHELWGIAGGGDLHRFTVLTLALGSSWHNTWLGIWADFGLPAVIFWAIFWIQAVTTGFWIYGRTTHRSPYRTITLMILLWFIIQICRSWTSGHSAENAFSTWWMFGVLVALKYNILTRAGPSDRGKRVPETDASELAIA
jgi:hypothetical protein